MTNITIPQYQCTRCNHQWIPRKPNRPLACPNCNSRVWNKPRANKTEPARVEETEMTQTIIDEIPIGDPADGATAIIFTDDATQTYGFRYHQNAVDGDDVTGFGSASETRDAATEAPYGDH